MQTVKNLPDTEGLALPREQLTLGKEPPRVDAYRKIL